MFNKKYTGTTNKSISIREKINSKISKEAAKEGIVLLRNNGILPLKHPSNIALFGSGARHTIKGGTGSGDVNSRYNISIEEGLKNAGFVITTNHWLDDYDKIYKEALEKWRNELKTLSNGKDIPGMVEAYMLLPYTIPSGRLITSNDIIESNTKTAIYVISRISSEGADRFHSNGDYLLTDIEKQNLEILSQKYENIVLILNCGGIIDLSFIDNLTNINAIVYMLQAGQEGGNALADILTGKTTPSGKLTDTWAYNYFDYPSSKTFSTHDNNVLEEVYSAGIYVGYKYFDSFNIKPLYEFGFGLSYTDFHIYIQEIQQNNNIIEVQTTVKNTGNTFSGKEVVQIYVSMPILNMHKEFQRLVAFAKTKELKPNEEQTLNLSFNLLDLASYDESISSYVLEKGKYIIRVGNSSKNNIISGYLELGETTITYKLKKCCAPNRKLDEIIPNTQTYNYNYSLTDVPTIKIQNQDMLVQCIDYKLLDYQKHSSKVVNNVNKLSLNELSTLVCGSHGDNSSLAGFDSDSVPGAAGETTPILKKYGINNIVMADGPAGIRITSEYKIDKNGKVYNNIAFPELKFESVPSGILTNALDEKYTTFYQYCTAMPIGTLLAQTWNPDILYTVGKAVGKEMKEFGITLWLAPGMNIHRNPLCGRNFEYFSEDAFVTGMTATAITNGVQSYGTIGTTIKHFACNNQEVNRMNSDSVISERALREIYLKGFEIAIKNSNPLAIMTSYNLLNGIHTANSYDLCTNILRNEWNFDGVVISDWLTTNFGGSSPYMCIKSGNDLIMPGSDNDINDILSAIKNGKLSINELKLAAANIINVILKSKI